MIKSVQNNLYKTLIEDDRYKFILEGLKNTILISSFAVILGVIIGIVISLIRENTKKDVKQKILNKFCEAYITIIRGTPIVLQLLIIYYVIFKNIKNINLIFVASLAFGMNSGAYVAEIIRAGINSIDKGQFDAAKALGLNHYQTMKLIILPQAIKNILPAIINEFISLIKETSVAGYIGVKDLTKASDIISSRTYDYFLPLIIIAIIYLVIVIFLNKLLKFVEERLL